MLTKHFLQWMFSNYGKEEEKAGGKERKRGGRKETSYPEMKLTYNIKDDSHLGH